MNTQIPKVLPLLVLLLYSCNVPQKIRYVQTSPFVKPLKSKLSVPLHIVLLEEVKDSFVMESSFRKIKVTEFRKTIADGLLKTLQRNISTVQLKDHFADTGLWLVIYRIKPFWRTDSHSTRTSTVENVTSTTDLYALTSIFQFESSLFLNSEKLTEVDIIASSNTQMHSSKQAEEVFKDGLTNLCEATYKELLKHEIFQEMNVR
jgi:hypothetical protein